ncbi:MAG TPA: hypothetical protein VJ809_10190 [Pirellulales bacterium]|jgi:hypothetical protein|nr:hypothetical protein [Pirellulales bacterium]
MSRLVVNPDMAATLHKAHGRIEVCDDSGHVLGFFHPTWYEELTEEARRGPFSDERSNDAVRNQEESRWPIS